MTKKLIYSLTGLFLILCFGFIAISVNDYKRSEVVPDQYSQDQEPVKISENYMVGKIEKILNQKETESYGKEMISQELAVLITKGSEKGEKVKIETGMVPSSDKSKIVKEGEKVVIVKVEPPKDSGQTEPVYYIYDKYRIPSLTLIILLFVIIIIALSRKRGIMSIVGLAFSIMVIMSYILPNILEGQNPLLVSLLGGSVIAIVSLYITHGFKKRTTIAVVSVLFTILIATVLGIAFTKFSSLYGVSSEEVFWLKVSEYQYINLKGLVLAGIIISSLGVLDDVASTQVATVDELRKTDESLTTKELYKKGIEVGKEHIASMVNTLVLVFVGASLPMFLIFAADKTRPAWIIANTEMIAEEIVRSMVGSIALALAVPITTFLAAYFLVKKKAK